MEPNTANGNAYWDIVRSRPVSKTYGRAIPAFILNMQYHLTTIDVYSDGAIDCWGFVDRQIFDGKLAKDWVATKPEDGKRLSVHNLGFTTLADTQWYLTTGDLRRTVHQSIQDLNPDMTDLVDMEGDEFVPFGKTRRRKMESGRPKPFRLDSNANEVLGTPLPVLVHGLNGLTLTQWFIFSDGFTRFGTNGPLMEMDEAVKYLDNGEVTTTAPDETWIHIPGLGRFRSTSGRWIVKPGERIREALDELAVLQGGVGSGARCGIAYREYEQNPTDDLRELLREAYFAVPEHLRLYCGDMDSKDWPIKRILGIAPPLPSRGQ